jgi:Holliday junction resolvasome RuvABC endonuclease subunit
MPEPSIELIPRAVAGFDFASRTGWAVVNEIEGVPLRHSGVWNLVPTPGESPGMRYLRLRGYLEEMRKAYPGLHLVGYERAHHRGAAATAYALGYISHLQAWCAEHGIEHTHVHSATLKKHATGSGRANKKEMIAAGKAQFPGLAPNVTDDEVDALWVLDWLLERYKP